MRNDKPAKVPLLKDLKANRDLYLMMLPFFLLFFLMILLPVLVAVIFVATIVIWFLQTFDLHLRIVQDSQDSILALVASCIAPIFKPLGFGDWRISTALITGFIAKESVVSTLTVLVGDGITSLLTVGAAAPLLVFCLLYTPCVAAIASVRRELGGKWALSMVAMQCGIAWICACLMRTVLLLAGVA